MMKKLLLAMILGLSLANVSAMDNNENTQNENTLNENTLNENTLNENTLNEINTASMLITITDFVKEHDTAFVAASPAVVASILALTAHIVAKKYGKNVKKSALVKVLSKIDYLVKHKTIKVAVAVALISALIGAGYDLTLSEESYIMNHIPTSKNDDL